MESDRLRIRRATKEHASLKAGIDINSKIEMGSKGIKATNTKTRIYKNGSAKKSEQEQTNKQQKKEKINKKLNNTKQEKPRKSITILN